MSRPVIGLSAYVERARWNAWDTSAVLLHDDYVAAVQRAGGIAVLLAPATDGFNVLISRLDGLILTGGPDVDPTLYRAAAHEMTDEPRLARDAAEVAWYLAARRVGVPVLGICRGLQIMAVAEGGTLHQHLPEVSSLVHRERHGAYVSHGARFAAGSLAQRLLGDTATVASSHHQAVADPGALTVSGWADDGTIEACEAPAAAFVLGVQWHPEVMTDPTLFEGLVEACRAPRLTAG